VDFLPALAVFLFGLAFGSFLNVCIHRIPRGLSVVRPRSACPGCGALIGARDNIPVLSWLLLGGRCRHCRASISPRYAAVELLTALLFLAFFLQHGLSLEALKFAAFGFLLLGLIFTDAEHKLLPDVLTLPGLMLGLAFSLLVPVGDFTVHFAAYWFPQALALPWRATSLLEALAGAAAGSGLIYGAGAFYLRLRGIEGMGLGDVKLMAMIGAFLGLPLTILTMFAASFAGALFGAMAILRVRQKRLRRNLARGRQPADARRRAWASARLLYRHYQMPFGVFLGGMALVSALFGDRMLHWYLGRFF
jgi:leader peptidase (prepilin peptidase)/N-methyltransferase